jgi:surfeit locus 1 family protein
MPVMRRSQMALLAMSLVAAAVCARLGFWQLDRLGQRRARNAEAVTRLGEPPLNLPPISPELARFRRARATGVFDFGSELVVGSRARLGAPGVHIATPLQLEGTTARLLVVRGWVYSPDAATVDLMAWRERDSATVEGYLVAFDPDSASTDVATSRVVRRLARGPIERRLATSLLPYYMIMTAGGASGDSVPRRLEAPVLDEGPHLSYSVQWFLFGTIFAAGGLFVTFRAQRSPLVNPSA